MSSGMSFARNVYADLASEKNLRTGGWPSPEKPSCIEVRFYEYELIMREVTEVIALEFLYGSSRIWTRTRPVKKLNELF